MKLDVQKIFIVTEVFYILIIIERDIVTLLFLFSYLFKLFIYCIDIFSLTCIPNIVLESYSRSFLREPVATRKFLTIVIDTWIPSIMRIYLEIVRSFLIGQTAFIPYAIMLASHDSRMYRSIRLS